MTSDYRIQPALWRLPTGPVACPHRVALAPPAWVAAFPRPDRSPPLVPLVAALRALAPGVLHAKATGIRSGEPFLWAENEVAPPLDAVAELVEEWAGVAFDDQYRSSVLAAVRRHPLRWEDPTTIDLAAWTPGTNGTAVPADPAQYPLLADEIARLLEHNGIDIAARHLGLVRVRQAESEGQQLLVSWPPEHETGGRGPKRVDEYWCLQLAVAVATVVWDCRPRVRVNVTRRRFLSRPPTWVPPVIRRQRLGALAHWPAQFPLHLGGLRSGDCLVDIPLRWKHDEPRRWGLDWFDKTGALFARLDLAGRLNPKTLAANPLAYPPEDRQASILVNTRNGIEPFTRVGHGLWQVDHRLVHDAITAALRPAGYTPEQPLPAPLRPGLSELPAPRVQGRVEAWCQSSEAVAAVRSGLDSICGPATGGWVDGPVEYQHGTLVFEPCVLPPRWAEPLPADAPTDKTSTVQRAALVADSVKAPLAATVAIIELSPKEHYRSRPNQDPYLAVKRGLVATGRVVQGLETPDAAIRQQADISHRGRHAAFDALRQLGAQFPAPDAITEPVTGGIRQVAIVPITRNNTYSRPGADGVYPTALVIEPDGETRALAFGETEPCELHELLCRLGRGQAIPLDRKRDTATRQWSGFVDHTITQLRDGPPTLLIAQRNNTWWRCLADKYLTLDQLPVPGPGPDPVLHAYRPSDLPNLRAARLDLDWVRHTGFLHEGNIAPTHGLYPTGPRRFISRGSKPLTRKIRENRSAFSTHPRKAKRPVTVGGVAHKAGDWVEEPREPFADAWNPATSEFTMFFLQPGDDPQQWAAFLHVQRHLAVQYASPLAAPAILHNTQLAGAYLDIAPERKTPGRVT